MAPSLVHLPNGQVLTVSPVFGGLFFKVNDLSLPHSPFPPGWTIVLHSEESGPAADLEYANLSQDVELDTSVPRRRRYIHRYKKPTLQNDHLYISSISNPSSSDFKPATSPTRQIAMMLWATLYWYFQQEEPDRHIVNNKSSQVDEAGRPRGDWKIYINREGIFTSKVVLPKLERMGLIASEESCVGASPDERSGEGWQSIFVSRQFFWQLDPRIYLFTLSPMSNSPYPTGTPYTSRPGSPSGEKRIIEQVNQPQQLQEQISSIGLWTPSQSGPFHSGSHLPTYYPPPPPHYVFTNNVRHPLRPKPPRQGETFYTRYIPSVGQYLSFRVASLSPKPLAHRGPTSASTTPNPSLGSPSLRASGVFQPDGHSNSNSPLFGPGATLSDVDLLYNWMNNPRVNKFWGCAGPREKQASFLEAELKSSHSFPVIGCWDDKPFGFFSIYWVKEDVLGAYLDRGGVSDYDRGFHCLVGEEEFRGPHRVKLWLSGLVHYCWLSDYRTDTVVLEPRVDNAKLIGYCESVGFFKEREISFPHKQAALMRIRRDGWEAPEI